MPCAVQPRDVAIVRDVWRYRFLSAPQLFELWWPGRSPRAGQRRLSKLFDAGFLERFRPITRRGSFPWTYQLGAEGHRMLQHHGVIDHGVRYLRRAIYEYGRVLHELQLNAWVLAYRRVAGDALLAWEGETDIDPPTAAKRGQLRLEGDWSAKGLRDQQARLVRPDAVLELEDGDDHRRTFLIEYDRTRRVDKNFGKFRRYDAFLNWWWSDTQLRRPGRAALRRVRLPGRRPAPRLHGSRRPRADRPPLASEHPPRRARVRRASAHTVRRRTRHAPRTRRRVAPTGGATGTP